MVAFLSYKPRMALWAVVLLASVTVFWASQFNPNLLAYSISHEPFGLTGMAVAGCHGGSLGAWSYICSPECPCGIGEGDCNTNDDCLSGLYCNSDRGSTYGWDSGMDICEETQIALPEQETETTTQNQQEVDNCHGSGLGTWSFICDPTCPCYAGEGDCDSNLDCGGPLVCLDGGGSKYGWERGIDTCEPPETLDEAEKDWSTRRTVDQRGELGSYSYCSEERPCNAGEGHCDSNEECTTGVCLQDVGALYGVETGKNYCVDSDKDFLGKKVEPKGTCFGVVPANQCDVTNERYYQMECKTCDNGRLKNLCKANQKCEAGTPAKCVCVPDCAGKECGSDGCGGSCPGSCNAQICETCSRSGTCISSCSRNEKCYMGQCIPCLHGSLTRQATCVCDTGWGGSTCSCRANGYMCANNVDCCSGFCAGDNKCKDENSCKRNGETATSADECCSGYLDSGKCATRPTQCRQNGQICVVGRDCCSGYCDPANKCGNRCTEGEKDCRGGYVFKCIGNSWVPQTGETCETEDDDDQDNQGQSPGTTDRCTDGDIDCRGDTVFKCTGNSWIPQTGQSCQENPNGCTTGDIECRGDTIFRCTGGAWVPQTGERCQEASNEQQQNPGTTQSCVRKRCTGRTIFCYDSNNVASVYRTCIGSTPTCENIGSNDAQCVVANCENMNRGSAKCDCYCQESKNSAGSCRASSTCEGYGVRAGTTDACNFGYCCCASTQQQESPPNQENTPPESAQCKQGFTCRPVENGQAQYIYCPDASDCTKCIFGKCSSAQDSCNPDATSLANICSISTTTTATRCEGNREITEVCNEGGTGQCREIGSKACDYSCDASTGKCKYWKVCNLDKDCRDPNEKCVITEQSARAYRGYGECVNKTSASDVGRECTQDCHCPGGKCINFRCVASDCSPNCAGKECGNDGCQGSCGTCTSPKTCNEETGKCVDPSSPGGTQSTCSPMSKGDAKCNCYCGEKGYSYGGQCKLSCGTDYIKAGTTDACNIGLCCCNTRTSSAAESVCDDRADNDNDGKVDCSDPDCSRNEKCIAQTGEICNDNIDNDNDGKADCSDTDCTGNVNCAGSSSSRCSSLGRGDAKCNCYCVELGYAGAGSCMSSSSCGTGYTRAGTSDACFMGYCCCSTRTNALAETICNDKTDNDNDGKTDCSDPDCASNAICSQGTTREICDDGRDNDGDGRTDCLDVDCSSSPGCGSGSSGCTAGWQCVSTSKARYRNADCSYGNSEKTCATGTTCQNGACVKPESPSSQQNDQPSQGSSPTPQPTTEICGDGKDNDLDGQVDEGCPGGSSGSSGSGSSGSTQRCSDYWICEGNTVTHHLSDCSKVIVQTCGAGQSCIGGACRASSSGCNSGTCS